MTEKALSDQDEDEQNRQPLTTYTTAARATRPRPTCARYLALGSVPLLWGTFTPSMKLLMESKRAPPVLLTNFASHLVGAVALAVLWSLEALPRRACLPTDHRHLSADDSATGRRRAMRASCELGTYLFCGQLTQLLGLTGTSATTNAILVQSSVVFVTLFENSARSLMPRERLQHLMPSLLALVGVALITLAPGLLRDAHAASAVRPTETPAGVACSLLSAAFYAMHTVRLSAYGDVDATVQATGQVSVNAILDVVVVSIAASFSLGGNMRRWLVRADSAALKRLCVGATWNGVMIVGGTTWAMSYAQRTFRASTAALAYAMEPLFASLLAALILGDSIEPVQLLGGVFVVGANVLAGMRSEE